MALLTSKGYQTYISSEFYSNNGQRHYCSLTMSCICSPCFLLISQMWKERKRRNAGESAKPPTSKTLSISTFPANAPWIWPSIKFLIPSKQGMKTFRMSQLLTNINRGLIAQEMSLTKIEQGGLFSPGVRQNSASDRLS